MAQNSFHQSGPWPSEYTLVERLRAFGYHEHFIQSLSYRQKYGVLRDREKLEAKKVAAQLQLTINFQEV